MRSARRCSPPSAADTPDVGASPGEVVRRKQQPLDTAGVPEPLKTLIEDLTQPDPARRPPDAAAALATIDRLKQAPGRQRRGRNRRRRSLDGRAGHRDPQRRLRRDRPGRRLPP